MEILLLHNPYMSRIIHGCRMRLVVNTYVGCPHRCYYCYMYSYTKLSDILNPRSKKEFEKRLDRDIKEYIASGKEKYPVYVSSNCEAFHPQLENRYHHTLYALRKLREASFPVIIMTKFPLKLLEPDYLDALDQQRTFIQITIPFLNSRFEPFAPPPLERIQAAGRLIDLGFKVAVRIDPLIPLCDNLVEGQSEEETSLLCKKLSDVGVKHVVSKCLRLASGIKKLYPSFYDRLKLYYMANGYMESRSVRVLHDDVKKKLTTQVYESCKKHGIALFTCVDDVKLSGTAKCDGCEEILKLKFIRN